MNLNLEELRANYKSNRKDNPPCAERLLALIELTKIKLNSDSNVYKVGKRLKMAALIAALDISERTISRWEQLYRRFGELGLDKKDITGRPPNELDIKIQKIITNYRKMYRWGSEVIQAHLRLIILVNILRWM